MAVTTAAVLAITEVYIPDSNKLDEAQMESIISTIITQVGDDDSNLPQISCEFLTRLAVINDALFSIDDAGVKKEVLGKRTTEWDTSLTADSWKDYQNKVVNVICPILGVPIEPRKFSASGVISSGEKICVNDILYP